MIHSISLYIFMRNIKRKSIQIKNKYDYGVSLKLIRFVHLFNFIKYKKTILYLNVILFFIFIFRRSGNQEINLSYIDRYS